MPRDEQIRVAFHSDAHELGGAEITLCRLLPLLSARVDAVVLGTNPSVVERIAAGRPGTPGRVLPQIKSRWDARAIAAHVSAIRRVRPRVLHVSLNRHWGSQWAVLGGLLLPRVRVVAVENAPRPSPRLRHRLYKRLTTRFLSKHVAFGAGSASLVAELAGVRPDRITSIAIGVPDAPLRQLPRPGNGPVVGSLARLDAIKGVDVLLRALPDHPDATAVVVGDGEERTGLHALAHSLGISERVVFTGWSDHARDFLTTFDVYVQASRAEGLPVAVIEAMLAGLPVIATDVGAVRDAVVHGETGFVVPPEDPRAISSAIGELLSDPECMRKFGAAGRARALERFSVERMATEFEMLYVNLAR